VLWRWHPGKCDGCDYHPDCRFPGGICPECQREPSPVWDDDFALAVEVYDRAAGLSGVDMNGYPQLTKLELVMDWHVRLRNERANG
jgi:hypothetical protein